MTAASATNQTADNGPCAVGSATQVLNCVPLSRAGKALVTADVNGALLMRRLIDGELDTDALRLLPYLMPIRQAVWWGCMCSWLGADGQPTGTEDDALRAAVAWVRNPGEAEWNAADKAASADDCESAGGCCAKAIGWAGYWAPGKNWTHRDISVSSRLIAGAALTALSAIQSADGSRRLLALSVEVARGAHPWDGTPNA